VTWCKKIGALGLSLSLVTGFVAESGATTEKKTVVTHAIKDEVAIYNAFATFSTQAARLTNTSTAAQSEAVAARLGVAFTVLQGKLRTESWPSSEQRKVQSVYSASLPLISDMALAGELASPDTASTWTSTTMSDLAAWVRDLNVVNRDLGLPPFTTNGSGVESCQADGATVAVALAAFHAQHRGVKPSKSALTRKGHGGPYLEGWPHSAHYSFSLGKSGALLVAAPPESKSVAYRGPASCAAAGI